MSEPLFKKKIIFTFILFATTFFPFTISADHANSMNSKESSSFLTEELKYPHIRDALKNKKDILTEKLGKAELSPDNLNILIVVYKDTGTLEIHTKPKAAGEKKYKLFETYPICTFSGELGSKRMENDQQVPEGFYYVEYLNPSSRYHLALKVSYPNPADRLHTPENKNPGGMIMIHGGCISSGCLAMTDDIIEEIYLLAVYAMDCGQKQIPVYTFPFRMTDENMTYYLNGGSWPFAKKRTLWTNIKQFINDLFSDKKHKYEKNRKFWTNLKKGFDIWTESGEALTVDTNKEGLYIFNKP